MAGSKYIATASTLVGLVTSVAGHAFIAQAVGANGVNTTGFAVDKSIPRNAGVEQPFQLDTTILKDLKTNPCGETLLSGSVDIQSEMAKAMTQGNGQLPSIASDGTVNLVVHQVNADGGGPFKAFVNTDATGSSWTELDVTTQPPGVQGLIAGGATDSPLSATIPSGTACTGGTNGNACLIRITNGGTANSFANGPGPFGGCAAVQQDSTSSGSASSNSTSQGAATATNNSGSKNAKGSGTAATAASKTSKQNKNGKRRLPPQFQSEEERSAFVRSLWKDDLARERLISRFVAMQKDLAHKKRAISDLTFSDIDDISTVTGASIDLPIDKFAGIDSADPNGGRSAISTGGMTLQQSEDLKQAVRQAIQNALNVLASPQAAVPNPLNPAIISAADVSANNAIKNGDLTSTSSAPTGIPSGDSIAKFIGDAANVDGVVAIQAQLSAASGAGAAAAAATSASGNKKGAANGNGNADTTGNANAQAGRQKSKAGEAGRAGQARRIALEQPVATAV